MKASFKKRVPGKSISGYNSSRDVPLDRSSSFLIIIV